MIFFFIFWFQCSATYIALEEPKRTVQNSSSFKKYEYVFEIPCQILSTRIQNKNSSADWSVGNLRAIKPKGRDSKLVFEKKEVHTRHMEPKISSR